MRYVVAALSLFIAGVCGENGVALAADTGTVALAASIVPARGKVVVIDELRGSEETIPSTALPRHLALPTHGFVLVGYDEKGIPLGMMRLRPKAGGVLDVVDIPSPTRGRGQAIITLSSTSSTVQGERLQHELRVELIAGGKRIAPDLTVARDRQLQAFWMAPPSSTAAVSVTSEMWTISPPASVLVPERGLVVAKDIPVLRRPTLRVHLDGAEKLAGADVNLELFPCEKLKAMVSDAPRLSECDPPTERHFNNEATASYTGILPGTYAYRWRTTNLSGTGWLMVDGFEDTDQSITISLRTVSGRVTRGDDGVAAHLVFGRLGTDTRTVADSDEQGRYHITLAEKGRYSVRIQAEGLQEFPDALDVTGDSQHDFQLPTNRYIVHVTDAADGSPVAQARVDYEVAPGSWNSFTDPLSARNFTGDDGLVQLPPIPSGTLKVTARQKGYRVGQATPVIVDSTSTGGEISVPLRKSATVKITLLAPEGTPVDGGFVWTAGPIGASPTAMDGSTTFESQLTPGAPLFAFDRQGRMAFTRWTGDKEQTIEIPPSGPPVTIRIQNGAGEPVKRLVRVGIDDVIMLDGPFGQQMFWSGSQWSSGADGLARIVGLPGQGMLTVFPSGRPDLAIVRRLPVTDTLIITIPGA